MKIELAASAFDEWRALHALLRDAFADMDGRIDPPSSMHRLTPAGLEAKALGERLLVARDDGRLLGCVFLRPDRPTMYLGKLAVRRDARGRGIGAALVRRALAMAADEGATAVELQVRVELVENRAWFAGLGFVRSGESAHAGYRRPTSVTMRRSLVTSIDDCIAGSGEPRP